MAIADVLPPGGAIGTMTMNHGPFPAHGAQLSDVCLLVKQAFLPHCTCIFL